MVPERLRERLLSLDASGLYAPPLNAGSRGGQRFIFHSAELAQALTRAVRGALAETLDLSSFVHVNIMPTAQRIASSVETLDLSSFVHVNPVFRCNRFEPGDRPFTRHVDTPYVHAALQQVSRYTLLLYLTGGEGQPVLDLEGGTCLHHVEPLSVVVFDQALEHEGRPFVDGRKVFLRTELIFQAPKVTAVPALGALFAQATYLTGESVFRPELEAHAKQAYDLAARGPARGPAPSGHGRPRGAAPAAHRPPARRPPPDDRPTVRSREPWQHTGPSHPSRGGSHGGAGGARRGYPRAPA